MASKLLSSVPTITLVLTTFALTGCFNTDRDKVISVGKCIKAANYLGDGELADAAEHKMKTSLSHIKGNAREAMEIAQEINDEIIPAGSSTKADYVLKVAKKWQNSSSCETTLEEFRTYIKEQATLNAKPIDNPTAADSCQRFMVQYRLASYPYAEKFSKELNEAVRQSIKNASEALKEYQQDYVEKLILTGESRTIGRAIKDACEGGGPIAEKIKAIKAIKELASPRTAFIASQIKTIAYDKDCGELRDAYCWAQINRQATDNAYSRSRQCDQDELPSEACTADEHAMIAQELRELELVALNKAKAKYEDYIAAPEKYNFNTASNIDLLADKCRRETVQTLKGAAYYDHVKRVCLPAAREEFLQPQKELLSKVNARLMELAEAKQ